MGGDQQPGTPAPAQRYRDALTALLDAYGIDADASHVPVDGPVESLHCLDTGGTGEPVVLLHGAGTAAAEWVPLLPHIEDRRVVVPERPGHGLSPGLNYGGRDVRAVVRSLLRSLFESLDLGAVTVVGNSFGGYHALSVAAAAPERVTRLVLPGAPAGLERGCPFVTRAFGVPLVSRVWYPATLPDDIAAARTVYRRLDVADTSALSDTFLECYVASTRCPGRRETLRSMFGEIVGLRGFSRSFLLRDELPAIDVPTRFVWGDADFFGDQALGRRAADAMPSAEFVPLEATGHKPWLEPHDSGVEAICTDV